MEEEDSWVRSSFLFSAIFLLVSCALVCDAQVAPAEARILFQIRQFLEYPSSLQSWDKWTDFCSLPATPSLTIICSGNHIVELSIVGNRSSPSKIHGALASNFSVSENTLSERFSLDSFLTVLTKLWSLQKLSLVSLGIWGTLPWKINRFKSLESLNMSSNFIYGEIPESVSTYPRLRNLVLSDNLFNGTVPDLSDLIFLQELDLRSNSLGPEFPSLPENVVRISLSNNSFRSSIPQVLKEMNSLQVVDLSANKLIGPIPSFLFSLASVQSINLGKNQLSGALDPHISCNANLSFVDISNNLLTGELPSCLQPNKGSKTVITLWNCLSDSSLKYQRSSNLCETAAIAVQPPDRRKNAYLPASTMKLGVVLSIIGGIVVVSLSLGLLMLLLWRRGNEDKGDDITVIKKSPTIGSRFRRHAPSSMRMTSTTILPPYSVFTLEEIEEATNNFEASCLLQEGPQGQVFKGCLSNGSAVLIKSFKLKQKHSPQALNQYMEIVSKLRHRNLVSVLGQCIYHQNAASSTLFIVLEYVAYESLKDHLNDWRKRQPLRWPQRMSIAMGVAKGIQYLHSGGVVGNHLKIDNILLDDNLIAKISNYNISLPSAVGEEDQGLVINPEKEDIYKLGVILVEVITGRPTSSQQDIDDIHFQIERSLAQTPSTLRDHIDPALRGTFAYESLKTVARITVSCLSKDPAARPTVEDVLWHMQYSVQVQEGWGSSGNLSGNLSGSFSNMMLNGC